MTADAEPRSWRLVPSLALADMRHEAVLTLCMIVALVAIIAPLMLLLGLRYGSIEMLRSRLVQNPTYREVWPTATLNLDEAWFEKMRMRPDVQFVIPTILRGASIIGARLPDGAKMFNFDLVPTAAGDPLLRGFGADVPDAGEVVLSKAAAEQLGVGGGAEITLEVVRQRGGRREAQPTAAKVIAVLPFEADGLERVYAPLDFASAVERYREGLAVPTYGWPGGAPTPYLSFDGVIVVLANPLDSVEQTSLRIGTGFSVVEPLPAEAYTRLTGLAAPQSRALYDVKTLGTAALVANVDQLRARLRGRGAVLLPYVRPLPMKLGGTEIEVIGLSIDADEATVLGVTAPPWGGFDPSRTAGAARKLTLPEGTDATNEMVATVALGDYTLSFPLEQAGTSVRAMVPLELLAALRTGFERRIAWNAQQRELILRRTGFFGFRLYAPTIDLVPGLYRYLVGQDLRVEAHVQEIERIRVLDRGLLRLFLLIATVGAIGGSGAMVASLYAAVDRKKRDLGVMRLMGLSRTDVSLFPIFQGITQSAVAVSAAAGTFLLFSAFINVSFADEVIRGGKICDLPPMYYVYVAGFTLTAALLSSFVAARRATRIEPAEAIREE